MRTVSASSIRQAAQLKVLREIKKKYTRGMAIAARNMLQAAKDAMEIDKEMAAEFAEALGDDRHHLIYQETFEPNGCACGNSDPAHCSKFKKVKKLAKYLIWKTGSGALQEESDSSESEVVADV